MEVDTRNVNSIFHLNILNAAIKNMGYTNIIIWTYTGHSEYASQLGVINNPPSTAGIDMHDGCVMHHCTGKMANAGAAR